MDIIIVGAGKLGVQLARYFSREQNQLTIIDISEERLENAAGALDVLSVLGHGAQVSTLEEANTSRSDLFIAVTSSDEINVLASSLAKRLGCKRVIARVRNPEYGQQLNLLKEHFDIDYIANPELEMAKEIARDLLRGYSIHIESFADGRVGMVDFRVHNLKGLAGQTLLELELPRGLLIAAILRDNTTIIPHGQTCLELGDVIYVIGERESLSEFSKLHGCPMDKQPVRRVMILGGGRAGYHLAHRLLQNHVQVRIVEQDEDRCEFLAEHLKGALIIHGDGTDQDLLAEENSDEMDALISMTGIDEENLLLALLGKQLGIGKVVAKVSRPNYIPIIEQLGIDLAVNPVTITAGDILRFAQGHNIVSLSLMMQGQAEVLEVIAQDDSRMVGKPLRDIPIPRGIIIGAVVRDSEILIPDGSAVIEPEDRVIIFCLQSEQTSLERLLQGKRGFFHELWNHHKGSR